MSLSSSLCGDLLVMRGCGDARCTTSEGSVVTVDVTVGCSVIMGRPFLTDGGSVFAGRRFLVGASGETDGVPSEGRETHELLAVVSPPPRCRPMRPSWPPLCFRRCFGRCSDGRCGGRPVVTAALPSPVPPSRVCFRRDVCGCRCARLALSVWCTGVDGGVLLRARGLPPWRVAGGQCTAAAGNAGSARGSSGRRRRRAARRS